MRRHQVWVSPLPSWLANTRFLGDHDWSFEICSEGKIATAELGSADAADLAARLRGLGFAGSPIQFECRPPLKRPIVRAARSDDARRRRKGTPPTSRTDIEMDDEGRVSWTPEVLALNIADLAEGRGIIDAGCGAGGNAIAFARRGSKVWAFERDAQRLAMAQRNATRYGVLEQICFRVGEALQGVLEFGDAAEIVFVDPPWGVDWDRKCVPSDAFPLLTALYEKRPDHLQLWAKLPSSFDTRAFPEADVLPIFGEGEGDFRRVKFLLLRFASRG